MDRRAKIVFLAGLALAACGKKDMDKVSEGQDCLNTATSTTALTCLDKVQGINSPAANVIRCSAYFVDQGFADPTRLSQISSQITSTTSPDTSSIAALSAMGFVAQKYNMTTNDSLSATALTACTASLSGGLVYLASMSRIATATLKDAGFNSLTGAVPSPTDMQNAICTGTPSQTTTSAMGAAALAAYNQNCLGKDITNDVMCLQYKAAIGSNTDTSTVGASLINTLCH